MSTTGEPARSLTVPPPDQAYIAALWQQPDLCLAFFGVQFHTPEAQRLYEESDVGQQMLPALEAARAEGLLQNRALMTDDGPVLMQYWRSYADLDRWARQMPHTAWWKWLIENAGKGLGFYHEIYQVKAAEAIFERGTRAVGPALFCPLEVVPAGEGRSRQRQQRFAAAAQTGRTG